MKDSVRWKDRNGKKYDCPRYLTKHVDERFYPNLLQGEVFANTIKSFNSLEWDNPAGLMSDDFEARNKLDMSVGGDTKKLILPGFHIEVSSSMSIGSLKAEKVAGVNDWAYCLSTGKYDVGRHQRLVHGSKHHEYPGNPTRVCYVVYETVPLLDAIEDAGCDHDLYAVQQEGNFLTPTPVTYAEDQTVRAQIRSDAEAVHALDDAYMKATSFKPPRFEIEDEFRIIMSFKSPLMAQLDSPPALLKSDQIANAISEHGRLQE